MDKVYQEKLSLLAMLVEMAWSDGEYTEEENDFINRLADLYEISDMDMLKIKSGELKPESIVPEREAERIPFFQSCVMAMGVDREVVNQERMFCRNIGLKMGLREQVIRNVMDLFEEHFPNPVPIDKLMMAYQSVKN